MKRFMIWLIGLYRKYISPLKPPCCRFTPSCSQYAIEAFEKRGFFVGFGLTVWRILRCNPFSKGGYDPVPEGKKKRMSKTEEKSKQGQSQSRDGKTDADIYTAEKNEITELYGSEKRAASEFGDAEKTSASN